MTFHLAEKYHIHDLLRNKYNSLLERKIEFYVNINKFSAHIFVIVDKAVSLLMEQNIS